jgi:hypothetical protein
MRVGEKEISFIQELASSDDGVGLSFPPHKNVANSGTLKGFCREEKE